MIATVEQIEVPNDNRLTIARLTEIAEEVLGEGRIICGIYGQPYYNDRVRGKDNWILFDPDFHYNQLAAILESAVAQRGYKTRQLGYTVVRTTALHVSRVYTMNPLRDKLLSLKWSGHNYFTSYEIAKMLGWSCPIDLGSPEKEDVYLYCVVDCLIMGAVARALGDPTIVDAIPVLISKKQGVGKTSTLRALADLDCVGKDNDLQYFASVGGIYSLKDKNVVRDRIVNPAQGKLLVELAECDSITSNPENASSFKAMLSDSGYTIRQAYGKAPQTIPWTCQMAGTTNIADPLSDLTGNRRFLPVACERAEDPIWNHPEVVLDIWAQAVHRYQNGDSWSDFLKNDVMAGIVDEVTAAVTDVDPAVEKYCKEVVEYCSKANNYYHTCPYDLADDLFLVNHQIRFRSTKLTHSSVKKICDRFGLEYTKIRYVMIPEDWSFPIDSFKPSEDDRKHTYYGFRLKGVE